MSRAHHRASYPHSKHLICYPHLIRIVILALLSLNEGEARKNSRRVYERGNHGRSDKRFVFGTKYQLILEGSDKVSVKVKTLGRLEAVA
jgi:hypothetical protein